MQMNHGNVAWKVDCGIGKLEKERKLTVLQVSFCHALCQNQIWKGHAILDLMNYSM